MRRNRSNSLPIFITFCAVLLAAPAARSQSSLFDVDPENHARGYDPTKAYELGELDTVNTFNGNLTLRIPIGQSYATGGGFSYGLTLAYNSQIWDLDRSNEHPPDPACGLSWATRAWPMIDANAGLGWKLSLGELYGPNDLHPDSHALAVHKGPGWLYAAPDGSRHKLVTTLHPGVPDHPADDPAEGPQPENPEASRDDVVFYSRDSSYLRLQVVDASAVIVETPDGWVRELERYDAQLNRWRVTRIMDRLAFSDPTGTAGNYLDVTYGSSGGAPVWTLTDSLGRTHRVVFRVPAVPAFYPEIVDRVELAALDGATPATAIYRFTYDYPNVRRPCEHFADPANPFDVVVPVLSRVELAGGSGLLWFFDMDYETQLSCSTSGRLSSLTLPTGGRVEWRYASYFFPSRFSCDAVRDMGDCPTYVTEEHAVTGVVERRLYDRGAATPSGVWSYRQEQLDTGGLDHCVDREQAASITVVTDPLGFETEHYYSVYLGRVLGARSGLWNRDEYGLAISHHDTVAGATHALSTRVLDDAGQPLRSTYLRFLHDGASDMPLAGADTNRRLLSRRTLFHDDVNAAGAPRWTEQSFADFDGLGNFRFTTSRDNFGGEIQAAFSRFNPGSGAYDVDPATGAVSGGFRLPRRAEPWVLGTSTESWLQQGASDGVCGDPAKPLVRTQSAFDDAGLLKRFRRFEGCQPGPRDLLIELDHDSDGNLVSSRSYGGDDQVVPAAAALADVDLSGLVPEFRRDASYRHGALETLSYRDAAGGEFLTVLRNSLDAGSGQILASEDAAGLSTRFEYDLLGRLTWILPEPGHDALTRFTYEISDVAGSQPARVTTRRIDNLASGSRAGAVLATSDAELDGLGRLRLERIRRPGGVWAVTERQYNAMGWLARQSEAATSPDHWTDYLDYDPFGRVGRVVSPDGSTRRFAYRGIRRQTATVENVATAADAASWSDVTTTSIFDRRGNPVRVVEPAGGLVADYDYDPTDRLTGVSLRRGSVTQTRAFVYDGRGLLVAETHPELGGTVTYAYDSRGHVTRRVLAGKSLISSYDRAERPIRVEDGQGRVWKEYEYAPPGSALAGAWGAGQLHRAHRHNRLAGSDLVVTETYRYDGLGGRISRRETEVDSPHRKFRLDLTYDGLGNVDALTYPRCLAGCGTATGTGGRTVDHTYIDGLLTRVAGFTRAGKNINYHPNGLISRVPHANGVNDRLTLNASHGMARPHTMFAEKGGQRLSFNTGVFTYDGAGNIARIGADTLVYDPVGRLTSALQTYAGVQHSQTYAYDGFGNLTSITTGGVPRIQAVDPATNRLDGETYDAEGHQTRLGGIDLGFDPLGAVKTLTGSGNGWKYLYTAGDERLLTYESGGQKRWIWRLRAPGNQVLTEYRGQEVNGVEQWQLPKDFIYRGRNLLATAQATTGGDVVRHFHLDHLGSTRSISDASGAQVSYHEYFPFGMELTAPDQDEESIRFTGHERDLLTEPGSEFDLDYMHARYYSASRGRFLGVDPILGNPASPQRWNRYAYLRNSPMTRFDPTGRGEGDFLFQVTFTLNPFASKDGPLKVGPLELQGEGKISLGLAFDFWERRSTGDRGVAVALVVSSSTKGGASYAPLAEEVGDVLEHSLATESTGKGTLKIGPVAIDTGKKVGVNVGGFGGEAAPGEQSVNLGFVQLTGKDIPGKIGALNQTKRTPASGSVSLKGVTLTAPGGEVSRIVGWLPDIPLPSSNGSDYFGSEQFQEWYQEQEERFEGGGDFLDSP